MHIDELDRLEDEARRTLKQKIDHAGRGHDWVVDSHSLTSCKLLELVALAKLGWPIWKAGGAAHPDSAEGGAEDGTK